MVLPAIKAKKEADDLEPLRQFIAMAKQDVINLDKQLSFEMENECYDKEGELTRVLQYDADAKGLVHLMIRTGQPISFSGKDSTPEADEEKLLVLMNKMSNIDLMDEDNVDAIGFQAMTEFRHEAFGFFTARLVASLKVPAKTEK